MRGIEAKLKQEAMRLRSERPTCPRKEPPSAKLRDRLRCPQAEEISAMLWHPEELDADLPLGWSTRIAHQPLCPRSAENGHARHGKEAQMCRLEWQNPQLAPGSPRVDDAGAACTPVDVVFGSNHAIAGRLDRQREDARARSRGLRLRGLAAIPLTLLAQWAGATTADAGCIHHTQAPIGLPTPLMGVKLLPCWTPECPIGLERKSLAGEATCLPGSSSGEWTIPGCRSS